MKVAPVSAEMVGETVMPEARSEIAMTATRGAEDGCAEGCEARGSELTADRRHSESVSDEASIRMSWAIPESNPGSLRIAPE